MQISSIALAAAMSCSLVSTLAAQGTEPQPTPARTSSWEFVIPSGTLIPTGAQRDAIKRGNISAVQLTYVARPAIAITSTFGWARSRDLVIVDSPKLDVFTYDVGAELRAPGWMKGKSMTFTPFAGAGAGGRSYNHRKLDTDATHQVGAYASAGGEVGYRRIRVRLEARDYVTAFKPLAGAGDSRMGNDVVVLAGLRWVAR
ncbi:MAG TPA: hypothetical protein VEB19_15620 [Gemmatimonadaceae bacterium]|nr:hypothetical protein [Gemmatimonadaceae bacterium]